MNPGTQGLQDSNQTPVKGAPALVSSVFPASIRNWRQSNATQAAVRLRVRHAFRRGLISRNLIRQIDWMRNGTHPGITVREAEKFLVENNVLDVGNLHPLGFTNAVAPEYFNNRIPTGNLIRGYDEKTTSKGQ